MDKSNYRAMDFEYMEALKAVMHRGVVAAPRKMIVKEIFNYVFTVDHPDICIVTKAMRPLHTRIEYAEAELAWYKSGTNEIKYMVHPVSKKSFAHLWEKFSDDGYTVNSAYGQYMFKQFIIHDGDMRINQWEAIVNELIHDKDSRRAIININQPYHKNTYEGFVTKDFPCCICMQFTIRDDKLNLQVVFRSQDVNTGLRNDVFTMCGLQKHMANDLGIECGTFSNVALNLHAYKTDWDDITTSLNRGL